GRWWPRRGGCGHGLLDGSVSERLASSHCSPPARAKPSPQVAGRQMMQASVLVVFMSSHSSTPACTKPSPHVASAHSMHPSVSMEFMSSHASTPLWTCPSPQLAATQVDRQASVSSELPSSQPSGPFVMRSPQRGPGPVQPELQRPYVPLRAPSSQASPAPMTPSPHTVANANSY